MSHRAKVGSKREKTVSALRQPVLPWAGEEPARFHNSLINLALAVSSDGRSAHAAPAARNGRTIAHPMAPGDAEAVPERPEVPSKKADASTREAGREPNPGRKDDAMAARATAAVVAKKQKQPAAAGADRRQAAKREQRDRVVMEHLPLVKAIAVRVHEGLPIHVELDDLVHAGILGLFDAASKYNPNKKVAFSSYAKHRIKGAILDSLRQMDWASRDMRRRHRQVEQVTRDLCALLHRQPTEDELAEKMGVAVSRWRQMALDLRNVGLVSASTRAQDQEELPPPDYPGTPDTQPDVMCAREQMRERLQQAMSVLPERYRKVMVLYYSNELTMKEIGGMLGINESRVSQIHKAALEKMAAALHESGITSIREF
jgi:RNA polymerase sigma factor for flagellar operon FliA